VQIQLNQFIVRNLQFEQIAQPEAAEENSFNFDFAASFYRQKSTDFFLEFSIEVKSATEFTCKVDFLFLFSTTEDITDSFMKSHFPIVNAPAIAFPYIRTFVSNFSLNAGYMPSILPSVNFTKVEADKMKVFLDGQPIKNIGELPAT
jgi:preprotein translocase subunit SecB